MCVAIFLVSKNLQWITQKDSVTSLFRPNPSPTTLPLLSLSFYPLSPTITPSQTTNVPIVIDWPQSLASPQLIQLEIGYAPAALLDVVVTPGNFFINPTILLNTVNTKRGRISYAITGSSDTSTSQSFNNQIAIISFTPNPAFSGKATTITFLGKTMIKGKTDITIPLETHEIKLFFATGSATQN